MKSATAVFPPVVIHMYLMPSADVRFWLANNREDEGIEKHLTFDVIMISRIYLTPIWVDYENATNVIIQWVFGHLRKSIFIMNILLNN